MTPKARIRYAVSMPEPHLHLFRVHMRVDPITEGPLDLVLPAWTPGSYKIRDFARHVQDFEVPALRWRKITKCRWRIWPGKTGVVDIRYKVYAFEQSVQTSHLDDTHAYFNGASLFPYVDGRKNEPHQLILLPPRGWRVATGLEVHGRNSFVAPNYDVLIDCPTEIGTFSRKTFFVRRVPHRLAIHGEGNYDESRMVRDLKRIVRTAIAIFRDIPYSHYTFILHTHPTIRGGLEHLNSTSLQVHPFSFRDRDRYEDFLKLAAHEFFHLWNVKRIHPLALGPFDYEREAYTTLLWAMEGITSYYDSLIPRRAGFFTVDRYLKKLAERILKYREKPGRLRQSLSDSSFDAWIKFYKQNEHSINSTVSYYEKGELVGLILDLDIRRRSKNKVSLDDVLRTLHDRYARRGVGFPEEAFKAAVEEVARFDFDRFFRDYVDGTRDIDFEAFLRTAGLELTKERKEAKAYLGVQTQRQADRLMVTSVLNGSPAAIAGVAARDELVALDGWKIEAESWEKRLDDYRPGERVELAVFRSHRLRRLPLAFGKKEEVRYRFHSVKRPTSLQKRIFRDWLKASWPRRDFDDGDAKS